MSERIIKESFSKVKQDILNLASENSDVKRELQEIKRLLESLNNNVKNNEDDYEAKKDWEEISIPGRLCLFGEHSDWAGGHRRQNDELERGYTIVAQTNQKIYARIRKLDEPIFRFKSALSPEPLEIEMDEQKLVRIARQGEIFSYVAGTAYEILTSYKNIKHFGVEIDNYKNELPVKKGLSSSASVCVLTVKAFDSLFKLNLTKKRRMELAYFGENNTPSRCGKMDQACAYDNPVMMIFDGDKIDIKELNVGEDLYFLIVDLKKAKNTVKILKSLSDGYPFPNKKNKIEIEKMNYLGNINKNIALRARQAIEEGDAKKIGELMKEAQKNFDRYLMPACPEELSAPKLHKVLNYPKIKKLVHGGKCIGSGGDGSLQLICKSKEDREKAKEILECELDVNCLYLDLKKTL